MPVPLLDLTRENQPLLAEIQAAMQPVIEGSQFILGKVVSDFEQSAAEYFELSPDDLALGVSSGTDAQLLALMALEIDAGKEFICPPYTFFSTAGVIARAGLKVKFVDIEPETYNLDPSKLEDAISEETAGIMPVHLYGQLADMTSIMEIANRHDLPVIEDACQSMGARHKNIVSGNFGDFTSISFFPTKNLGAFGDAGMLISKRPDLREKAIRMRVHGMKDRYEHLEVGGNFRIDALQAAILSVKLKYLPEWHEMRRKNASFYAKNFADLKIEQNQLEQPIEKKDNWHIYNQYVVRVKEGKRDALKAHLDAAGIGNMIYYPTPLHTQPCFQYLGYKAGDFPVAEHACTEVLALPIHPFITQDEIRQVCEAISSFYKV